MNKAELKRKANEQRAWVMTALKDKKITTEEAAKRLGKVNRAEQRQEEIPDVRTNL